MSATGRRAELIRIMRGRKKDTVANLARELAVNEKTIRRDLLTLTVDDGFHIDTMKGKGGGIIFHGHNCPHRKILSQEQIKVLREMVKLGNEHQVNVLNGILDAFA